MISIVSESARGKKEAPPNNCASQPRPGRLEQRVMNGSPASNFHVQSPGLATELYNSSTGEGALSSSQHIIGFSWTSILLFFFLGEMSKTNITRKFIHLF